MKKLVLLLIPMILFLIGDSQITAKRTDSIVRLIESKKPLTVSVVSDTFPVSYADLSMIESVKFYSSKNKLVKVIFSDYYCGKDSTRNNVPTGYDVFYFSDDVLIKVISRDFDQSPQKICSFIWMRDILNNMSLKRQSAPESMKVPIILSS